MITKRTLTQADADFLQNQFSKVFATKQDISGLKQDVSGLKQDIGGIRKTIAELPTKKDVEQIVVDAINTVVIPGMDNMAENIKAELASKEDVKEIGMKIDSLYRKFTAQQDRLDLHNARIEGLEKIHPRGKHLATI
jgi:uncharacterized coiled-coil DUF342 family protein